MHRLFLASYTDARIGPIQAFTFADVSVCDCQYGHSCFRKL